MPVGDVSRLADDRYFNVTTSPVKLAKLHYFNGSVKKHIKAIAVYVYFSVGHLILGVMQWKSYSDF